MIVMVVMVCTQDGVALHHRYLHRKAKVRLSPSAVHNVHGMPFLMVVGDCRESTYDGRRCLCGALLRPDQLGAICKSVSLMCLDGWLQETIVAAAKEAPEHQRDIAHWLMDEAQKVGFSSDSH